MPERGIHWAQIVSPWQTGLSTSASAPKALYLRPRNARQNGEGFRPSPTRPLQLSEDHQRTALVRTRPRPDHRANRHPRAREHHRRRHERVRQGGTETGGMIRQKIRSRAQTEWVARPGSQFWTPPANERARGLARSLEERLGAAYLEAREDCPLQLEPRRGQSHPRVPSGGRNTQRRRIDGTKTTLMEHNQHAWASNSRVLRVHRGSDRNKQYPLISISACCSASTRSVMSHKVHSSRISVGSSACFGTIRRYSGC